ncbi:transposase [Chryseobacterium sp. RP-3-3]|uniref:Transposase n=1 Tax=Chryseobacterium antibioticum TaxID=2728847 RepID=A0A7Y0FS12_9FLAO|nr:transposase [Chryseobacterium antibioticum]NML70812.1 transposase [Chryseobacterium antibioticum]
MNFKDIHIGNLIYQKVAECGIEISRICNFLNSSEEEVLKMYDSKSLDSEVLLRWSKLLEYDFFRIYNQHLILYAPQGNTKYNVVSNGNRSSLPQFKKNIYTKEMIEFILEKIEKGGMTKLQVINEYKIPKTTLYKWIDKYRTT